MPAPDGPDGVRPLQPIVAKTKSARVRLRIEANLEGQDGCAQGEPFQTSSIVPRDIRIETAADGGIR